MTYLTTTTTEKEYAYKLAKDARGFVAIGDKLHCRLTKAYDNVGMFANALVEKEGEMYSVSGLLKGFFGNPGSYTWAEVINFDNKGKIAFEICEEPMVEETVIMEHSVEENTPRGSFEEELKKAEEKMRREFESKLKEAEARIKHDIIKEEVSNMVQDIAKITGTVSPKASDLLSELLMKSSASEMGKALAVVAANHDSSYDFVKKMEKVLWGCL